MEKLCNECNNYQYYDIPASFEIARHLYNIIFCDFIDNGDTFGLHDNIKLEIKIALKMKDDDGNVISLTKRQVKNTFYHELFHAFNYYYNTEQDEALAQTFANFMQEFDITKQYNLS